MYLKKAILIITFLFFTFGFSLSAYAAPDEKTDTFFNTFKINQEKLASQVNNGALGLYSVSSDWTTTLQKTDEAINNYRVLVLNNGYSKLSVVTFSGTKILSGKGEETTLVGVNVFNVKDGEIVNSNPSIQKIGVSGIYNASMTLKTGDNSVVIAVKKGDLILYRLFKVTVKQEQTKGALENMQLIFMQTEKNSTTTKPTQGSIIKQFIGTPVIDTLAK